MSLKDEIRVEQIKTARGYVPTSGVEVRHLRPTGDEAGPWVFAFTLRKPDENALLATGSPGSTLLSLASCVRHNEDEIVVDSKKLKPLAERLGPLFGASGVEPILDWAAACTMADLAVSLQQIANGARGISNSVSLFNLEKLHAKSLQNDDEFDFFDISRSVSASYLDRFGGRRVMADGDPGTWSKVFVRHAQEGGNHIYVFLILSAKSGEEQGKVELAATSLGHVMSRADYGELRKLVSNLDDDRDVESQNDPASPLGDDVWLDMVGDSGNLPDDGGADFSSSELDIREAVPSEQDVSVLADMVRTLITAHLAKDAHVDPFQADETTGNITFDTLLSWAWFDFSKCLGEAKIGYCTECATPFSLVGHRGIERSFCCPACKTKAKNRRAKILRDGVRKDFLEKGKTLNSIVRNRMADKDPDQAIESVREMLKSWPRLKHLVEDSIRNEGANAPLAVRCFKEGLTPEVLSNKAIKLIEAEAAATRRPRS